MNHRIEYNFEAAVICLTVKDIGPKQARRGLSGLLRSLPCDRSIVIDLSELVTLNPAGIGLLVSWISDSKVRRQRLVFCAARRSVLAIMELVRIPAIVKVCESREDALAAFEVTAAVPRLETQLAVAARAS